MSCCPEGASGNSQGWSASATPGTDGREWIWPRRGHPTRGCPLRGQIRFNPTSRGLKPPAIAGSPFGARATRVGTPAAHAPGSPYALRGLPSPPVAGSLLRRGRVVYLRPVLQQVELRVVLDVVTRLARLRHGGEHPPLGRLQRVVLPGVLRQL